MKINLNKDQPEENVEYYNSSPCSPNLAIDWLSWTKKRGEQETDATEKIKAKTIE